MHSCPTYRSLDVQVPLGDEVYEGEDVEEEPCLPFESTSVESVLMEGQLD